MQTFADQLLIEDLRRENAGLEQKLVLAVDIALDLQAQIIKLRGLSLRGPDCGDSDKGTAAAGDSDQGTAKAIFQAAFGLFTPVLAAAPSAAEVPQAGATEVPQAGAAAGAVQAGAAAEVSRVDPVVIAEPSAAAVEDPSAAAIEDHSAAAEPDAEPDAEPSSPINLFNL